MRQLNLPKKYTVITRVWLSTILIILAAVLSFTPLFQLDLKDSALNDSVEATLESFAETADIDLDIDKLLKDKSVDVSAVGMFRSFSLVGKLGSVLIATINEDEKALNKASDDFQDALEEPENQKALVMTMTLVSQLVDIDGLLGEGEDESSDGELIATIFQILFNFALVGVLIFGYLIVWPIVLCITALVVLIRSLSSITRPDKYVAKTSTVMIAPLAFAVTSLLFLSFLPGISWGSGMTAIVAMAIAAVVVNVISSRLRAYNLTDFKYATLVQGAAVLQVVGLGVYMSSALKAGFLRNAIKPIISYVSDTAKVVSDYNAIAEKAKEPTMSMPYEYLIVLGLLLLAAIFVLAVVNSLIKTASARIGLVKYKKAASPASLKTPIIAILSCVLPIVAANIDSDISFKITRNGFERVVNGPLFEIGKAEDALIGMFVGAFLLLATAIAFMILRKVLCGGMTKEQAVLVMNGEAPAYAETAPAVAEATVEETSVDEVPAEEVPAEEVPAEEVPAEEVPAEEVPAEEVPAEDTVEA